MTEYASLADLLSTQGPDTEDIKLVNGMAVQVRGLTRYEYSLAGKVANNGDSVDIIKFENLVISYGMQQPKLTPDQVLEWSKIENTEVIDGIMNTIMRLSGKRDDAEKSGLSDVRGES